MYSNTMIVLIGAGLAAGSAHGAIVRTDINQTFVGGGATPESVPFDVNNNGSNDLQIDVSGSNITEWSLTDAPGSSPFTIFTNTQLGFQVGDEIGPSTPGGFDFPGASSSVSLAVAEGFFEDAGYKDGIYGNQSDPTAGGFLALGLELDGQFGAIYFDATPFDGSGPVTDAQITVLFAEFETSGGAYTIVPAPSALAVLAMGGVAAGRRQRRSA